MSGNEDQYSVDVRARMQVVLPLSVGDREKAGAEATMLIERYLKHAGNAEGVHVDPDSVAVWRLLIDGGNPTGYPPQARHGMEEA